MQEVGIERVHQLEGILKYFEEVGGSHYRGDCSFDYRTALNPNLEPAGPVHVRRRAVVTPEAQQIRKYVVGKSCPGRPDAASDGNDAQVAACDICAEAGWPIFKAPAGLARRAGDRERICRPWRPR
jgi:UPF0176 protein